MKPFARNVLFRLLLGLTLWTAARADTPAPADGATQAFDVPSGKAERTLVIFAHQSVQPTLFPTDMVKGAQTRAIKGDFVPAEALRLMLAGSALEPVLDAATNTLAIRLSRANADAVIELPPYVVEEKGEKSPAWRYASVTGLEVISRCSDDVTRQWIDRQHRLHELLALILPREFQGRSDVPTHYILFSEDATPEAAREMVTAIRAHETRQNAFRTKARSSEVVVEGLPNGGSTPVSGDGASVRFLPNFRFWDQDSRAIFFVMNEAVYDPAGITLTPGYVRSLIESRRPALPAWFGEGLVTLYETIRLPVAPVMAPLARPTMSDSAYQLKYRPDQYDIATFKPFVWVTPQETEQMIRAYAAQAERGAAGLPDGFPFLPLTTLFSARPALTDEAARTLWRFEAALFINWALNPSRHLLPAADGSDPLDDPKFNGPQALWKFLTHASAGPVTEANFKECFGFGYAEAEGRLLRYLPLAAMTRTLPNGMQGGYQLALPTPPAPLAVELREATPAEVGRIKGRLDRLEIAYVRELYAAYPDLVAKYVTQARHTLRRAYDRGSRDPLLLAELGLCEIETGTDAAALPFLEAAVAAKIVRPRVYYELARIRYATIRAKNAGEKLSPAEAGDVLQPLTTALRQAPALPEIYELIAEVWLRSAGGLSAAQLAVLDTGVRLFPHTSRLVVATAILHDLHGNRERARALVNQGLSSATAPADRDRLQRLQAALRSTEPTPGPPKIP